MRKLNSHPSLTMLLSIERPIALIVTLMTFIVPLSYGQIDSSLSYYPLHVGDIWMYATSGWGGPPFEYSKVSVIGDTTLLNGLHYYILKNAAQHDTTRYLERVDSATTVVFHVSSDLPVQEQKFDSLAASLGDTVYSDRVSSMYVICDRLMDDTLLGVSRTFKYFSAEVVPSIREYALARGFGLVYQFSLEEDPEHLTYITRITTLIFARINGVEFGTPVSVVSESRPLPKTIWIGQNYPNPFNPTTRIPYILPAGKHAILKILNLLGQLVREYTLDATPGDRSEFILDASSFPSGTYFCTLIAGSQHASTKILVVK